MDYNKKGETPLLLGHGSDSLMSWCPGLNIYRVNRFNILTNDKPRKQITSKWITEDGYKKFDIIEELLLHNLVHIAEEIFAYVGFPYTWSCLRVNRLWYDFLANHLFPRWAEQLISQDPSLNDIYQAEELTSLNPGKICWQGKASDWSLFVLILIKKVSVFVIVFSPPIERGLAESAAQSEKTFL